MDFKAWLETADPKYMASDTIEKEIETHKDDPGFQDREEELNRALTGRGADVAEKQHRRKRVKLQQKAEDLEKQIAHMEKWIRYTRRGHSTQSLPVDDEKLQELKRDLASVNRELQAVKPS